MNAKLCMSPFVTFLNGTFSIDRLLLVKHWRNALEFFPTTNSAKGRRQLGTSLIDRALCWRDWKFGKCLENEGNTLWRGSTVTVCHAACPSEASHSEACMDCMLWRWNQSACLFLQPVLPSDPFLGNCLSDLCLPTTFILACAMMSFELKPDFNWAPLSSSWLYCAPLVHS